MSPVDRNTALARLSNDLADRPQLLKACERAVKYLCQQPPEALQRISFGLIGKAAGLQTTIEAVPIAEYLSSGRLHLLDKQYVLIVDDEEYELSIEDVDEAKRQNVLYHPDRGEEVSDFSSHLYLFFTPSVDGKEVFCGARE